MSRVIDFDSTRDTGLSTGFRCKPHFVKGLFGDAVVNQIHFDTARTLVWPVSVDGPLATPDAITSDAVVHHCKSAYGFHHG